MAAPAGVPIETDTFSIEDEFKKLPPLSDDVLKALGPLLAWMNACHDECDANHDPLDDIVYGVYEYITPKGKDARPDTRK